MFDAFTGFDANSTRRRSEQWSKLHNVKIFQGDGKWSVHGSPCDALHGAFRMLTDIAEDVVFCGEQNPLKRKGLADWTAERMQVEIDGNAKTTLENLTNVGLWAFRHIPASMRRWAWVSRGYFTKEEMAKMCGCSEDEISGDLQNASEGHKKLVDLLELNSYPVVESRGAPPIAADAESPQRSWLIAARVAERKEDLGPTEWGLLPRWTYHSIEQQLTEYTEKVGALERKIAALNAEGLGTSLPGSTRCHLLLFVLVVGLLLAFVYILNSRCWWWGGCCGSRFALTQDQKLPCGRQPQLPDS